MQSNDAQFTIEFWFLPTETPAEKAVLIANYESTGPTTLMISLESDSSIVCNPYVKGGAAALTKQPVTMMGVDIGKWHHYACISDKSQK